MADAGTGPILRRETTAWGVNMCEAARAFDAIVRRDGLKAALAWRDRRFEERLADQRER